MKTYLFDFDGTLVDSMPTYAAVMKKLLIETNTPFPDDLIKIITPLGNAGTARYYIDVLGCPLAYDEIIEKMNGYMVKEYSENVPAKEGVIETVKAMKKRGCGLNVLTASSHRTLDPCLKRLGIFDLFDNVWSCDDFATSKADPKIYHMAAERIGKRVDEVIFVDDNLGADRTAKAAGMRVYGIYDDSSAEYTEQIKAVTDGYAYKFAELLDM